MKTIKIALLIICSFSIVLTSSAQQTFKFDKIRVAGPASVELRQGDTPGVTFEDGATNIDVNSIVTTTEDGWLIINGPAKGIIVTANKIEKIDISGPGKLESQETFKTGDMQLAVTGSGKIEMNLQATNVKVNISGAGKIELKGDAEDLYVDISGAGKVDAENLKVKTCTATISGSGKCLVDVSEELTSNITGSGSIYYVNKPVKLNSNITGSGRIADANSTDQDTTRIILGKKKVLIVDGKGSDIRIGFKDTVLTCENKVKSHWAGFEMGVNLLMDDNFSNTAPDGYKFLDQRAEKSIALNFNIADYELNLYRKNIMLVTGIGFSVNNYRFNSDSYLAPDSGKVVAIGGPSFTLSKNKLVTGYITVPLLLELNTSEKADKTFHFAAGVIGGYRIHSHLKLVEDSGSNEVKNKIYDDFNLNPFRVDATIRLGFRNFTVFGSYGLTNFFKSNNDPELHALTVGVRLAGW